MVNLIMSDPNIIEEWLTREQVIERFGTANICEPPSLEDLILNDIWAYGLPEPEPDVPDVPKVKQPWYRQGEKW